MQEMQAGSLGREDLLEKGTVTHSSILAWEIPWTEESGGLQSNGLQRVGHDWSDLAHTHIVNYPENQVLNSYLSNSDIWTLSIVQTFFSILWGFPSYNPWISVCDILHWYYVLKTFFQQDIYMFALKINILMTNMFVGNTFKCQLDNFQTCLSSNKT